MASLQAWGPGPGRDLRVGDVVRISCPFTKALVAEGWRPDGEVTLRWPWWSADPDCSWFRWNGAVVVDGGTGPDAGGRGLFRTDPAPHLLTTGDTCRVGIPPTLVHVIDVAHYDPPQETGRLPRPSRLMVVLPAGRSYDSRLEEQGESFDPDDDIPVSFAPVLRPYAFLEPGDEVADSTGRAWRFDGPWDWCPFDGVGPHEPVWPLVLLTRRACADVTAAGAEAAVAGATRTGSHRKEIARWSAAAQAEPPSSRRHEEWREVAGPAAGPFAP
ncbi:hypothetical protein [Streptomyces sp. NPDC014685]|uniref:hypothetical protein n=1 Tax=Streptomyces sp. NPDC014685 TaxID=3364881 RepID=UPI003700C873